MDTREELIRAAKAGQSEVMSGILDSDSSLVDTRDQHGWTLLCHAALHGHTEVIRLLIERGADVRLNKPIHYAGQRGHREICRLLVDAGAVDHLVGSENEQAVAAYRAMYRFDAEGLEDLLGKKPELAQVRQVGGSTMLHEAATHGAIQIMKVLIQAGAELDAKNEAGQTALDRAVIHNQIEAARFLIDRGAVTDILTAVKCGAAQKVAQMIDSDASLLQTRDPDGCSLLQAAMMLGQKELVSQLLGRGALDPKGLGRQFCDGAVFENRSMAGTLFRDVNLSGAVFQNVNLSNAVFHYLNLGDASIDYANINGLKIFGVEVGPLVEAELARKRGD
ncbi:MAG TPA: ankyrin repeat domain-containing protein [Gemmataceae bacterium]|jgi:ankyrin repeat protein|nr:ankyrin repeat domain-containing protein [Gemmataceae bacterium]